MWHLTHAPWLATELHKHVSRPDKVYRQRRDAPLETLGAFNRTQPAGSVRVGGNGIYGPIG